ncbi:MAG: hypothetical protein J0I41_00165 [Filimonas sp.]|nr:hypothetical protein [Filimonas sp.]
MITLNQIKYKLIDFFKNHKQVNEVSYTDDFSFAANRELIYPVVNIEYLEANVQDKKINHSYNMIIGDLIDAANTQSEDEVISDAMQIAEDFFAWLWEQKEFVFMKNTNIQKFSDDNGGRVSGITFRIALSILRNQNICNTPINFLE